MRAVQSIKIFTRETERSAVWMNRYAEVVRGGSYNRVLKQAWQGQGFYHHACALKL